MNGPSREKNTITIFSFLYTIFRINQRTYMVRKKLGLYESAFSLIQLTVKYRTFPGFIHRGTGAVLLLSTDVSIKRAYQPCTEL